MKAELLHLQVDEGERTKVSMTFSARWAADLEGLLPTAIAKRLNDRDVHLDAIGRDAAASGFAQGKLIDLMDGNEHIQAWLE